MLPPIKQQLSDIPCELTDEINEEFDELKDIYCLLYTSSAQMAKKRRTATYQILKCALLFATISGTTVALIPVSYTHLDVYKRQRLYQAAQ